jgi:hypothetical protein
MPRIGSVVISNTLLPDSARTLRPASYVNGTPIFVVPCRVRKPDRAWAEVDLPRLRRVAGLRPVGVENFDRLLWRGSRQCAWSGGGP